MVTRSDLCFLFFDTCDSNSKAAKKLVVNSGMPCAEVPSRGIAEPQLVYRGNRYIGIQAIKKAVTAKK